MKKLQLTIVLLAALLLPGLLSSCKGVYTDTSSLGYYKPPDDIGNPNEPGTLIIKNLYAEGREPYSITIYGDMDMHGWDGNAAGFVYVAMSANASWTTPFSLTPYKQGGGSDKKWTGNGTYTVRIQPMAGSSYPFWLSHVKFTNGSAIIDYDDPDIITWPY